MNDRTEFYLNWLRTHYYISLFYGFKKILSINEALLYAQQIDIKILNRILKDEQYIVLFAKENKKVLLYKSGGKFYFQIDSSERKLLYYKA